MSFPAEFIRARKIYWPSASEQGPETVRHECSDVYGIHLNSINQFLKLIYDSTELSGINHTYLRDY